MAEFYNAETLLEFVKQNTPNIDGETTMQCVERAIKEAPTADVVSRELMEQIKWERDIAIEQLTSYGVCLGEKKELEEVKRGEWILTRQSKGVKTHQCSVCGRPIYTINEYIKDYAPYCHCGAKMDGERK